MLDQTVVPPWAGQMRRLDDGAVGEGSADDRPIERSRPRPHSNATAVGSPGSASTSPTPGPVPGNRFL